MHGHLANGHLAIICRGNISPKLCLTVFVITFVFMYVQFMDAANIIIIADFCTLIYNQLLLKP